MSFERFRTPDGKKMIRIVTPEGTTFEYRDPSTKPLDPEFKKQSDRRIKLVRQRFNRAVEKAKKLGVPLHKIIPVS